MKLEPKKKKFEKFTAMWKLNNTLLNNEEVKEEIMKEVRKYFNINGNEDITYKTFWVQLKLFLGNL